MFFIKDYVLASDIWPNAVDYKDLGYIAGYVRGYNIEVTNKQNETKWLSCEWTCMSPEQEFDDEFHRWYYKEHEWVPTGRICFRGYGIERYDIATHEHYVDRVQDDGGFGKR